MTEKDAVKCRGFADARLWSVPVTAQLDPEQADELLLRITRPADQLPEDRGLDGCAAIEILACPVCKGPLKYQRDAQLLVCRMDRLAYPIRDDVPVMLEEEARQLAADDPLLDHLKGAARVFRVVIPARYDSARLPGKVCCPLPESR